MAEYLAVFAGEDTDAAGGSGLWITNGTASGTLELTGISGAYTGGITPFDLTVFNSGELFAGEDAAGDEGLWVTNGTAADTQELTGISGSYTGGLSPYDVTAFNGEALFGGTDAAGNVGLWVTNGTAAGTHELTGISGAATGPGRGSFFPSWFIAFGSEVLFAGQDTSGNLDLWVTNGTAAGTHELTGISGAFAGGLAPGGNST